jgi:hypothetical protein
MRNKIWRWSTRKLPEGVMMPWWALAIRAALFPIKFLVWRANRDMGGYCWETDTWLIEGVRYSGAGLHALAQAQGEVYRITRTGNTITVERVE